MNAKLRKGDFVVNKARDMEYRVERVHRDGTVTLRGHFPLRDGKRRLGCYSGDLTYREPASCLEPSDAEDAGPTLMDRTRAAVAYLNTGRAKEETKLAAFMELFHPEKTIKG
jgi:hypothetical protein